MYNKRIYRPTELSKKPLEVWREENVLKIKVPVDYPFEFIDEFREIETLPVLSFLKKYNFFEDELAIRPRKEFSGHKLVFNETFTSENFAEKTEIIRVIMYSCGLLLIRTDDRISFWNK